MRSSSSSYAFLKGKNLTWKDVQGRSNVSKYLDSNGALRPAPYRACRVCGEYGDRWKWICPLCELRQEINKVQARQERLAKRRGLA